jgi:hypothetical protein
MRCRHTGLGMHRDRGRWRVYALPERRVLDRPFIASVRGAVGAVRTVSIERRLRMSFRSGPRSGFNCAHARTSRLTRPCNTGRSPDFGNRSPPCDVRRARLGLHAYACKRGETADPLACSLRSRENDNDWVVIREYDIEAITRPTVALLPRAVRIYAGVSSWRQGCAPRIRVTTGLLWRGEVCGLER